MALAQKLLQEASMKVRELAAGIFTSVVSKKGRRVELDDRTRKAIRQGRDQAGGGEFVSDEDRAAFFKRHGVKNHGA